MYTKPILRLCLSVCCSAYLNAGGDFVSPLEPEINIPDQIIEEEDILHYGVFLSGGISFVNVDANPSNASEYNDGALASSGGLFEIGFRYRFNKDMFTTVNYQVALLDMAHINNYYVSINYQFSQSSFNPYIGAILGGSQLNWSDDPHKVLIDRDLTSESSVYGVQIGMNKLFNEHWGYSAKYQFLKYDHELDIQAGRKSIKHTSGQNLLVGVEYAF